jgi:hypothetical protein
VDAATVAWAAYGAYTNDAFLLLTAAVGNTRAMGTPTGLQPGALYTLRIKQDGTGSRLVTWPAVFKWISATAPVLSTTAGYTDLLMFVSDGTNLYQIAAIATHLA